MARNPSPPALVARTRQRVVVADDDVLLREGIAGLLERAGFEIAGQAGDVEAALGAGRVDGWSGEWERELLQPTAIPTG
jgi:hypothetical protein